MKKILICFLILSSVILAENKVKLNIDYAVFAVDSTGGLVEFYYSFSQDGFKIVKNDSSLTTEGILLLTIYNSENNRKELEKGWRFFSKYDTTNNAKTDVGLLKFTFPIGKYDCIAMLKDANSTAKSDTVRFGFEIKKPAPGKLALSDIEVASSILSNSPNKKSIFYKNSFEIVPNASTIFGLNFPVIFFYNEIYNLKDENIKANILKLDDLLLNSQNKLVYKKSKYISRKNSNIVNVGTIKVNKYPSGMYNLIVSLSDTAAHKSIASVKKVFIYNPSILDTTVSIMREDAALASNLGQMSEDELNLMLQQSKYVATQTEINQMDKILTLKGKRSYLHKFWAKKDENPETPQNETMIKYFQRVDYANKHFTNLLQKQGWKTDFGRVYITYGKPDEIERFPSSSNMKPYEIWKYNSIEGGVIFVFGDETGYGDYRLLHSTKRGELQDYNWQQRIYGN